MKRNSLGKTFICLFYWSLILSPKTFGEENIAWEKMSQGDIFNYFNLIKNEKRKRNQFLLKKAKFNILNGDLKAAEFYLKTISSKNKTIHFPKKKKDFKPSFFFLKKTTPNL